MKGDTYSGFTLWNKNASFSKNEKEFFSENIRRILTTRKGERVNEPELDPILDNSCLCHKCTLVIWQL